MPFTVDEQHWINQLKNDDYDQSHLIEDADEEGLKRLLSQVQTFDRTYPGGLLNYIKRARQLLSSACNEINPFSGFTPTVPAGEVLVPGSTKFSEFENLGLNNVGKLAFVLVAGGLGERLGYPNIKIALPIDTCTEMTYMEYYIRMIIACERHAEKDQGKRPKLPLVIMTSEDTHDRTVKLLQKHQYFGLPEDQVTLITQLKVPALLDNDAHLAVLPSDRYTIETKPHGHGDVHTLLNQHGLPKQWIAQGKEWMLIFQDTNGLVSHAVCPMLGVSVSHKFVMNSLVIPRQAGEAVGAVCRLEPSRTNASHPLTINIEYNQLNPLLVSSGIGGDRADPSTGLSPFPGNANVLIFHLPRYEDVLNSTAGMIPEFVNPKYKDEMKNIFKTPTRLECLMQEFPRLLREDDKVGITQLDRWLCFSTVKNNVKDAAAKSKSGGVPESAFTGESDEYFCYAKLLEIAARSQSQEVDIAAPTPASFLGIDYHFGPKIIMYPSFAITLEQVKHHIKRGPIRIARGATLILEGEVDIEGLEVDGALILKAIPEKRLIVKGLKVNNKGWSVAKVEDDADVPLAVKIRGYTIKKQEQTEILAD